MEFNGVININKEKGYTSHDAVMKVRRALKTKKVGHAGTLDPDAEGILTICIGKGTKLVEYMTEKDKEYVATVKLGIITDTQDISGQVLETREAVNNLSDEYIKSILKVFEGDIMQVPPMYSAIKINGKKLYELAREGREVDREARKIHINEIEFLNRLADDEFTMRVACSKGTYIRTLCHDIGERIGCGACMKTLLRTKVANFTLDDCLNINELENEELVVNKIIPVDDILNKYKKIFVLDEEGDKALKNGNKIYLKNIKNSDIINENSFFRIYNMKEQFVALYKSEVENGEMVLKIEKMF